jgi:AraC family transcriptional regulator
MIRSASARFQQVQPVLSHAVRHLDEEVTLAALAQQARLSPFHLHRTFADIVGETPKQLTLRLRLERAAAMLLVGPAPVLEVALACGFAGPEVFTRAFRRHYGMAPSHYRQRGLAATREQTLAHTEWVGRVGHCISLFHRMDAKEWGPGMTYEIEKKTLEPQPVLLVRRRVPRTRIAMTIGTTLPQVFIYAQKNGIAVSGYPLTRYPEIGPGMLTLETGMRVASGSAVAAPEDSDVKLDSVGGTVAMTTHFGPYDQLTHAYAALEVWIAEQGLQPTGAPWEAYCNDPGDFPDPKDWKTEVFWPCK